MKIVIKLYVLQIKEIIKNIKYIVDFFLLKVYVTGFLYCMLSLEMYVLFDHIHIDNGYFPRSNYGLSELHNSTYRGTQTAIGKVTCF